jgi:WD40 repeat protein
MSSPVTQPHMAIPAPPGHPTGPYPTGPVPPQGPWIKSTSGLTVIGAAAAVVVLALALLIGFQFLPDREGEQAAGEGTGQTEDAAGDSTPAAEGEDEEGSAGAGDDDGLVALAEATQGDLVAEMPQQHVGAITAMAVAELDGAPIVLTGGDDGIVRIWNPADGELLDEYRGHESAIMSLGAVADAEGRTAVFSSDHSTDAAWYLDDPAAPIDHRDSQYETIHWYGMWDSTPAYATEYSVKQLFTGTEITDISTGYGYDLRLVDVDGALRAVSHYENRVTVLDLETGEAVGGTFDQLQYDVLSLNVGQAAGKTLAVTAASDGSIQAWDLATAEPYGTAAKELYQTVTGLSLLEQDGKAVVIASGEKGLSLFDLETGAAIGERFAEFSADAPLTAAKVVAIDGHQVAVTGNAAGQIRVWSL